MPGTHRNAASTTTPARWEYAPAPESIEVAIAPQQHLFINGVFSPAHSDRFFPSINPATEEKLCDVAEADGQDVELAVKAATDALRRWKRANPRERSRHLFRLARRIAERSRELAALETTDGGKPIREARDIDLPLVAQHFFYHAGWADKLRYALPGVIDPQPVGVCGQIIPWNFPLLMCAWKLAPALACGNTCVLKPAETTSLTALRLAEILQEIDFPKGIVNIITGAGETGRMMVDHPGIHKIAFTGSTAVGREIARALAGRNVRLTLELGGKSPNIIFDDAAIDQAIEGIVQGIFFNQGHVCCAGSRLLVQESIRDEVVEKLENRMQLLRVGDPMDKNTDVGAINSKSQLETIQRYIQIGVREGATLCSINECSLPERGYWHRPCFLTNVQPSHTVAREEIFGPVLAVMTFRTPQEAVERANNTPYGLSAGVWTNSGSRMFEIAKQLRAGVVWCNTFNQFDPASPFGGYRESGFGREGGIHGLAAYLKEGG
ncbi:MAG: aldehyde dehydrogenase family protein [Phycisphaerales bacterium]